MREGIYRSWRPIQAIQATSAHQAATLLNIKGKSGVFFCLDYTFLSRQHPGNPGKTVASNVAKLMRRKRVNATLPLAHAIAAASSWWNRLPAHKRKPAYRPAELQQATGLATRYLAASLPLLGWHRARHWSRQGGRRKLRVLYAPPGHQIPAPARGRPPITLLDLFGG